MQPGAGARTTTLEGVDAGCAHLGFRSRLAHSVYWVQHDFSAARNPTSAIHDLDQRCGVRTSGIARFDTASGSTFGKHVKKVLREERKSRFIEHIETAEELANPDELK